MSCNRSRGKCTVLCHCEVRVGPPTADGNRNRYIVDCFVVELLAMTPRTQLVRREWIRLSKILSSQIRRLTEGLLMSVEVSRRLGRLVADFFAGRLLCVEN